MSQSAMQDQPMGVAFSYYGNRYFGEVVKLLRTRVVVRFRTREDRRLGTSRERTLPMGAVALDRPTLNRLTAKLTAFRTFQDMLDSSGGAYRPTIRPVDAEHVLLADAFDRHMMAMKSPTRAYRGQMEVVR